MGLQGEFFNGKAGTRANGLLDVRYLASPTDICIMVLRMRYEPPGEGKGANGATTIPSNRISLGLNCERSFVSLARRR